MIKTKNRDTGIDLVKFVAIIGVLIIHLCPYTGELGSPKWAASLFWGSITRGSVPLFIMASGALMLSSSKTISLKKLYFKNILRLLIAMFLWAMAYKGFHLLRSNTLSADNLIHGFKEVLLFDQEFHFYYVHIIIIFYVFLPITRTLVHNSNQKQLIYILCVFAALGVIYPTITEFWPFTKLAWTVNMWELNMVYAAIGFGILGYYIKNHPFAPRVSFGLIICGFATTYLGTYFCSMRDGFLQEAPFLSGMGIGATMLAMGFFSLLGTARIKGERARDFVAFVSAASFCVYLCHMLVVYIFGKFDINATIFHPALAVPCMAILVLIPCLAVYFVISKIPVLKNWIV